MYGVISSLSSEHTTLHGVVGSFDFRDVHEARRAADKPTTREIELRDRLETTFSQDTGTVGEALGLG